MNGKEIFNLIYDEQIKDDECIEVICERETNHFILKDYYGDNDYGWFDNAELMSCLLFKEYKFQIIKQNEACRRIEEQQKQEKIKELEQELKKLKNEKVSDE